MRTTQAARYARWSAMLALLLAASVGGVYVRRAWQERQARQAAPSSVPATVEQQSAAFSFSKVDGDRTEFTLRAAHATQFAGGDRNVLDDVWVTLYGKDGSRADNLHTNSCEYLISTGGVLCDGGVEIDLQSAEDARLFPATLNRPNPAAHIMHVSTSKVTFNRKDGTAVTAQPVFFKFPQGHGSAVGLRYESQQGALQLLHDVDITLERSPMQPSAAELSATSQPTPPPTPLDDRTLTGQPLRVCGSSLLYRRDERIIHLEGPVRTQQGPRRLDSGRLAVELDAGLHARRIVATDHPKLLDSGHADPVTITADELSTSISAEGWIDRLFATGNVRAVSNGAGREDRMDAGRAVIKMDLANRPQQLIATQNVVAESQGPGLRRTLNTSTLTMDFVADSSGSQSRISHVTTPAATLDWQSSASAAPNAAPASSKAVAQHMHMVSQHLDANFGDDGELRDARGTGGVQVERQIGSGPIATSTSREMLARVLPGGDWSSVDQAGDVHLRQQDRTAQSELSHFDRLTDTAVLSGSVVLADAQSRVNADKVTFHQLANEFHAEGHVVTSEVSAQNGTTNLAPSPARISADNLVANSSTGQALYSGQARLWQGDSLIQADKIQLDRATHVLTATDHVRAVFPQAAWQPPGGLTTGQSQPKTPSAKTPSTKSAPKSWGAIASTPNAKPESRPEFWSAEAGRFTYASDQGRGRLEQNVYTHSSEGAIRADAVDLFFAPAVTPAPAVTSASATAGVPGPGGQQLVRATAIGRVLVEEEDRHGTGSRADYTASEGKFVLSGGPPIVYDSSGNSTTGRELTLFFADDRIVIDSAEGLRTLTLHRVEK